MTAPVFVCPAAADAVVGAIVRLTGAEARHAATVQRRVVGERIGLIDGAGTRASGEIVAVDAGWLDIEVDEVSRDDDPSVTLVQALAKGDRDEQSVEAATELGVTEVIPWAAHRSIVQWRGPKADKGRAAWEQLAVAAAKQSRRALVPTVGAMVTTPQLAAWVRERVAAGAAVLVLHEDADQRLASLEWHDARQPVALIVGPEGGIGDDELATLVGAGAVAVVLGPHVLRASSAGPAAIAALAALRGEWGPPRTTLGS